MTKKSADPIVFWFTGLSGAGKTTLALRLYQSLISKGFPAELLDGDAIRNKTPNIGFSKEARLKHLDAAIDLASEFQEKGSFVVASFITPYEAARTSARAKLRNYIEVFVETPLPVCESRDPKGLYKKARSGEIKNFTGITSEFERPKQSDIIIDTSNETIDASYQKLTEMILKIKPDLAL